MKFFVIPFILCCWNSVFGRNVEKISSSQLRPRVSFPVSVVTSVAVLPVSPDIMTEIAAILPRSVKLTDPLLVASRSHDNGLPIWLAWLSPGTDKDIARFHVSLEFEL